MWATSGPSESRRTAVAVKKVGVINPAPVMRLVEVAPSLATSEETMSDVVEFVSQRLGKVVVRAPDRAGFVVNLLLIPYLLSAVRMLEEGLATLDHIAADMKLGTGHPMGPLELCDLIGNDVVKAITDSLYREYREPHYTVPPLLNRMVHGGLLGRKSGRGFYDYH
jgi:3-hydroxybutyryl-CoA dehydrogenase